MTRGLAIGAALLLVCWCLPGPARGQAGRPGELEDEVLAFTEAYFAAWSSSNAAAIAAMQRSYAPFVMHYGKATTFSGLLAEKQTFVVRWPLRAYSIVPGTVSITCVAARRECTISAAVRWDCKSPERQVDSTGVSNFAFDVAPFTDGLRIVAERGATVSRVVSAWNPTAQAPLPAPQPPPTPRRPPPESPPDQLELSPFRR